MSWKKAFIKQAVSDFDMWQRLGKTPPGHPPSADCHRLHYLQMATEKLSKGICAQDSHPPPQTHAMFVKLLKHLKQRPEIRDAMGYRDKSVQFVSNIDSLMDLAMKIERLAPSLAGEHGPNSEYPWHDPRTGRVIAPCEHSFSAFTPGNFAMSRMLKFLDRLFRLASDGRIAR